jgi:hypothetical protein
VLLERWQKPKTQERWQSVGLGGCKKVSDSVPIFFKEITTLFFLFNCNVIDFNNRTMQKLKMKWTSLNTITYKSKNHKILR